MLFRSSDEQGTVRLGVRKVHSTANTIRLEAVKKAGTEKAKKIEEASIFGALVEVSGIQDLLGLMGYRLRKSEAVYEDEHAKVETFIAEGEETEPVVVDTSNI